MAEQASLTPKRTLDLEETTSARSTIRGPVQTGKLGLPRKGRYHLAPPIPQHDHRKKVKDYFQLVTLSFYR